MKPTNRSKAPKKYYIYIDHNRPYKSPYIKTTRTPIADHKYRP